MSFDQTQPLSENALEMSFRRGFWPQKCPWITFWVKNPCGMTFPEHFLRVAGFGQMTHPNSVNSTQPSSMMLGYGQASNFGLKSTYWKGFSKFSGIGSQYSQNIYSGWEIQDLLLNSSFANWWGVSSLHVGMGEIKSFFIIPFCMMKQYTDYEKKIERGGARELMPPPL